jgi:alpha-beta hydrolase superfamily lysophospholipase
VVALAGFVALNILAYFHAHSMMHFVGGTERTHEPETLSLLQKLKVLATGVKIPRPVNHKTPADIGLPFETVTFSGAHGLKLEAWRVHHAESKGTVILFHGYTASKDTLLNTAKEFFDLGWDAMLVDFYGSGGSEGSETSVGYYEADDVAAAFEYVRADKTNQPVVLYGVSMGAAAILRAVSAHELSPDALILECPFDRLLTTVQNRFAAMRLPSFPAAQLLVFWGGVQQGFNGFHFNPADYAHNVRCPTLLMHGEKDPRVRLEEMQHIAKNLNSNSVSKVFSSVGHQDYLSSNPVEWHAYVTDFLRAVQR